jgi:hypothetical protein
MLEEKEILTAELEEMLNIKESHHIYNSAAIKDMSIRSSSNILLPHNKGNMFSFSSNNIHIKSLYSPI